MKKRMRMIMAMAVVLLSLLTSGTVLAASSGKCGDNITWTLDDDGNLVLTGSGPMGDYLYGRGPWKDCENLIKTVSIGDGITSIGDYTFQGCSGLTSVVIPNSVTSIGNSAFYKCSNLTSIVIPSSVTSIEDGAFMYCRSLTSVVIPSSVTSIGNSVFSGCSSLTSIKIPNLVKSIGNSAFSGCSSLAIVEMPNSVTSIGNSAFSGCSSLAIAEIPSSVTSIGNSAFSGCSSLTSVEIPNSVTSIGNWTFSSCRNLTSVSIPSSVTSIGDFVFYYSGITSVSIPSSVTSIGNGAFAGCESLTRVDITDLAAWSMIEYGKDIEGNLYASSNPLYCAQHLYLNGVEVKGDLVIPNTVSRIGSGAYMGWKGITSIKIPSSITSIGNRAFAGCESLTRVDITDLAAWSMIEHGKDDDGYFADGSNLLYYAQHLYLNGEEIKDNLVIPNTATKIGCGAYAGWKGIKSVEIPSSVTSVGDCAFMRCSGLTSVAIPNSLTSIGDSIFIFCNGLTSVKIPSSVKGIGKSAFRGCSKLRTCVIGRSVKCIGEEAFRDCGGLDRIEAWPMVPPVCEEDVFKYVYTDICELVVPEGCVDAYWSAEQWRRFRPIRAGVDDVVADKADVKVAVVGSEIAVTGEDAEGAVVEVYGIGGELVYKGKSHSIVVPRRGIYIVSIAGKVQKVAVQ